MKGLKLPENNLQITINITRKKIVVKYINRRVKKIFIKLNKSIVSYLSKYGRRHKICWSVHKFSG